MNDNKLVSFCLFSYNQESYIRDALNSVVKQTYEPLEIIISDDASTDSTYSIIKDFKDNYSGNHKIIINRNEKTMGIGGHFSKVFYTMASGDYLVVLGGDDASKDNHVERAVFYLETNPEISLVDFNADVINERGEITGPYRTFDFDTKRFTLNDYLQLKPILSFAPGRVFKRSLLSDYDPISQNCPTEDSVLVLRGLCLGDILRVNERLVYYRRHDNNLSNKQNMPKLSNIAIIAQYYIDVLKLFSDKKIDELTLEALLRRINFEHKFRKLIYRVNRNKLMALVNIIRWRLLKVLYKFNLKKSI